MILKANKLLSILLFIIILCLAVVCVTCTNSNVSANAADGIIVFQNDNIVHYSAKSYIDSSGKFTNFSSAQGQFSNALYASLDIKIDNEIIVIDPIDITIANHNEIKVPNTYTLNLKIAYGENEYIVNGVKAIIEEKSYEKSPTVTQTAEVKYNALLYMKDGLLVNYAKESEPFQNPLFDALSFEFNNNAINDNLNPSEIFFYNTSYEKMDLFDPNNYTFNILFDYLGNSYFIKNVTFQLKKSILNVSVELNGQLNLTIKEGEDYTPRIVYSGFLRDDNKDNKLDFPARIPNEPKRPIDNYEIRAEGAVSKYYEINYISSYITITSNPTEEITYTSTGEDLLILRGSYSPYCELEFIDVGVSLANVTYTEINNTLERFYSNTGIFDKYKPIASYRINLKINEQKEELMSSQISIKMGENLKGHDEYFVVNLTNDGVYQVVSATVEHGYLSFYTADLGNFVVLVPIKGVNTTQFVLIAFIVFVGFALCIVLFAVFRRKY